MYRGFVGENMPINRRIGGCKEADIIDEELHNADTGVEQPNDGLRRIVN